MAKWFDAIFAKPKKTTSWIRNLQSGSLYKISDMRGDTDLADIRSQIDVMRALAQDSQIGTALSYYATDTTTVNTSGQMIWATPLEPNDTETSDIVNGLIKQWKINDYARDHILELATIGNLYIPTSRFYGHEATARKIGVALDSNTLKDEKFRIIPSTQIPPEDIVHIWKEGEPVGFIHQPADDKTGTKIVRYPEESVIHFSLGGLIGKYTITVLDKDHKEVEYDIQFSDPMMENATQPTRTLSLLEDSLLLASLARTVKFINVDCSDSEDTEIKDVLEQIKNAIEQQLSINTASGIAESYVNPQSPNNLIYLPKVNGADAISVTDLNMAEATEADNKLLEHYQNKKLSVLGIPKEALNFSSNEGLGGAGSVMSQRSALYANALMRLETAYVSGWTHAFNTYFTAKGLSGMCDKFVLHMNPIITEMSTVQQDRRDAALSQAQIIVDIMKSLGVSDDKSVKSALVEILNLVFPEISADIAKWRLDLTGTEDNFGGEV